MMTFLFVLGLEGKELEASAFASNCLCFPGAFNEWDTS